MYMCTYRNNSNIIIKLNECKEKLHKTHYRLRIILKINQNKTVRPGVECHPLMLLPAEINCPVRTELSFLSPINIFSWSTWVYKMWVFLAEFAKIYLADIFEFGAVEEEVLLGLYSSFFTQLAQPLLFGQP